MQDRELSERYEDQEIGRISGGIPKGIINDYANHKTTEIIACLNYSKRAYVREKGLP